MRKTALALAAILALSGTAFANDFAATLHYPNASPRAETPAARKGVDYTATHSIKRQNLLGKLSSRHATGDTEAPQARKAPAMQSGIEINPWIVPSFQ